MITTEESAPKTLLIAVCVALICSAMVTTAVYFLRPIQAAYAAVDRNRAIVTAAYDFTEQVSAEDVVDAFLNLEAIVLDLEMAQPSDLFDGRSYDHWETESDQRYVPVYLKYSNGELDRLVLPVHGSGMWSTLYGYLALRGDLNTVAALVILKHGETPGIGDRIQQPEWLGTWTGKRIRDGSGAVRIDVTDDVNLPEQYRIDAISGATITSRAVGNMVRDWLGPDGYGTVLENLGHTWALDSQDQP